MADNTMNLLEQGGLNENQDDLQQPLLHHKPSGSKARLVILGVECLESTAFFGIATNLVGHLTGVLHETNSASATHAAIWTGTCYLTPLFGAIVADTFLGSYKTTFFSAVLYLLGMITITLSSLLPALTTTAAAPSADTAQNLIFYAGLYLVAFGSGGVKSSLLPLGADQFDDSNPVEVQQKGAFFSGFYICVTIGMLVSSTVVVWIQDNVSWPAGYGVATTCMALAVGVFTLASTMFRVREPSGSPLMSLLQVVVAASKKMGLKAPIDSSLLFEEDEEEEEGEERLVHTDQYRILDKAAIVTELEELNNGNISPWRLCTVTQVEQLKKLLRMVPIWLTSIIFSIGYAQMSTTFLEQGEAMDTKVGPFSIPPATLPAFEVLCVVGWTMFFDNVVVPVARRYTGNSRGLSTLQQMTIGRVAMALTIAMTAIVETKRLQCASRGEKMNIAWQLPQYFMMGAADSLNYIGQIEFFYEESPESMRSTGTALNFLSISLGNYGSSFLVTIIGVLTTSGGNKGWIPDNLDEGHLDYFFWGLAGLMAFNLLLHLASSKMYALRKLV